MSSRTLGVRVPPVEYHCSRRIIDFSISVVNHNIKVSQVSLLLMLFTRKLTFLTRIKLHLLISLNFAYTYTC
jgi:hypothetical protein